ncbi:Cache 3/Cache 2 fusion domain-containing protein, partial [candidate division KSB1 bacterium]|nr:Cache 3/Cache 2 fusion domain-containing protein [candidate division KSB1 bacterium]
MSIRTRMIFWVLGGTLIVFSGILAISYFAGKIVVMQVNRRYITNLVHAHSARFEADFRQISQLPNDLARTFEIFPNMSEHELKTLLHKAVLTNDLVYGSAIAFEPYSFKKEEYYYSPYYYRDSDGLRYIQLGDVNYRYFHWDWYTIPKLLKKPIWTEPYYDEGGGGTIMTTFSVPFFNPDSSVRGIVTADIDLEKLRKTASEVKVGETGYAIVVSQNGTMIVHPDSTFVMRESVFSIAEEKNDMQLRLLGQKAISGNSGIEIIQDYWRNGTYWFAYTPIKSTGWSFAVMLPEKEVMACVIDLNKKLVVLMIFGFFGLLLVVIFVSYSLTKPLKKLTDGAKQLAGGSLDTKITGIK